MPVLKVTIGDDELSLPATYEVCSRCHGEGVHDPEAFSNGFSQEELDDDPDFREAYFEGCYDVTCEVCDGKRVELVVDEDRADPDDLKLYYRHQGELRSMQAEVAAERRMGC